MTTETRECKTCKGTGINVQQAFTTSEGKHYPESRKPCWSCEGRGHFSPPDFKAIVALIKGRKGLRSARPDRKHGGRPYYVWRMARFHGGADVTMPVCASMDVHGDPYTKELDAFADLVAKRVFGTDLAAAHRWGRALGYLNNDMPGLPDSAYTGGRVADENKPIEEALELF